MGLRRSERLNKGIPRDRYMATLNLVTDTEKEPKNVQEVLSGPNKDKWKMMMDEEIDSLLKNVTWVIVPTPKENENIVSSMGL